MTRVTAKGQVTIPKAVREALGLEPGDEVVFVEGEDGIEIRKEAPVAADGTDPFKKYRGHAESDATMAERMRRLRGTYPRDESDTSHHPEPEPST
jgi:AbrB family looped-hinge helix DNA binding protein